MRISDWSSDVCSSDLFTREKQRIGQTHCPISRSRPTGSRRFGFTREDCGYSRTASVLFFIHGRLTMRCYKPPTGLSAREPPSTSGSRSTLPLLHVVILAIVQGITEFLPISSSGHLVLAWTAFYPPGMAGIEQAEPARLTLAIGREACRDSG